MTLHSSRTNSLIRAAAPPRCHGLLICTLVAVPACPSNLPSQTSAPYCCRRCIRLLPPRFPHLLVQLRPSASRYPLLSLLPRSASWPLLPLSHLCLTAPFRKRHDTYDCLPEPSLFDEAPMLDLPITPTLRPSPVLSSPDSPAKLLRSQPRPRLFLAPCERSSTFSQAPVRRIYDINLANSLRRILSSHKAVFEANDHGGRININKALECKSIREFDEFLTIGCFGGARQMNPKDIHHSGLSAYPLPSSPCRMAVG